MLDVAIEIVGRLAAQEQRAYQAIGYGVDHLPDPAIIVTVQESRITSVTISDVVLDWWRSQQISTQELEDLINLIILRAYAHYGDNYLKLWKQTI